MDCPGLAELRLSPSLALVCPVVSKERFAEISGLEIGVIRGMLDRGYLPSVKIGRHRLVNVAALQARCIGMEGGQHQDSVGGKQKLTAGPTDSSTQSC